MRWNIIKNIIQFVRKILSRDNIWIDFPVFYPNKGKINIYTIGNEKSIGEINYYFTSIGNSIKMILSLNDNKEEIIIPRTESTSLKISGCNYLSPPKMVIERYGLRNGIRMISLVLSSEIGRSRSVDIRKWSNKNSLSEEICSELINEMKNRGLLKSEKIKLFATDDKPSYKKGNRVRIQAPTMDYGELGWILDEPRKYRGKYLYTIIVDGSSTPMEFSEEWISPNKAGVIYDERL